MEFKIFTIVVVITLNLLTVCAQQEKSAIYRPCDIRDYACVGAVLQENSNCTRPVQEPIKREFVVPHFTYQALYFNSTYVETNQIVKNLDRCYLAEFYINPVTDKVVLGVECPNVFLEADRTFFRHRTFIEDQICRYHAIAEYPLVRMTLIMSASSMDLGTANIWSEVLGAPKIVIQSLESDKPDYIASTNVWRDDLTPLGVFEAEAFDARGTFIARRFIQSNLCNYGYFTISLKQV